MDGGADNRQRTAIAEALAQERLATASELAELKRALSGNPDPEEVRKRLDGLIQRISLKLPRHQTDANWDVSESAGNKQVTRRQRCVFSNKINSEEVGHDALELCKERFSV